jgi:hypothetical protein
MVDPEHSVLNFVQKTRRNTGRRLIRLYKLKRGGIHAVAQASRFWAVVENVSEVRVASLAEHFVSLHSVTVISLADDIGFRDWRPEAWPASTRLKFCIGFEEVIVATDAPVNAFLVIVPILTGEGAFSAFASGYFVLFTGELLFPFGVCLDDLFAHNKSFLRNGVKLNLFLG